MAYSNTLASLRKVATDYEATRKSINDTIKEYLDSGKYNKAFIRETRENFDNQLRTEKKKALKQIDKLEKQAINQIKEKYSIFGNKPPRDLTDILQAGYKLNKADYEELLVRYAPNRNALRLISESADDRGYIIRGIPTREEEEQALTNYCSGIRNFIHENDSMKRRFPDLSDVEAFEKTLTRGIDPKYLEVTTKPKNLAEAMSQDIRYDKKVSQLAHDKEAILEEQIISSIFDGNKEEAEKLSKVQSAYNMTTEERTEKLRQNILNALTPDMEQDIKWMRTYKNQDVSAPITDKELAYIMSGDYKKIYEDRAAENGKESDYPNFLQFFKDFHDESEADPKNK